MSLICIIDADSIPYICSNSALAKGLPVEKAYENVDKIMDKIMHKNNTNEYIMIVSGANNYRYLIDPEYKKFRIKYRDKTQAGYYPEVKRYMIQKYKAYKCIGAEADDVCATLHTKMPEDTVIVSSDKDLLQVPGVHYNHSKDTSITVNQLGHIQKTNNKVTASGDFLLYFQMLIGDSSDGIEGIRKIGPITAYKILNNCKTTDHLRNTVEEVYKDHYGTEWLKYYNKNYSLLKINTNIIVNVPEPINYHYI